MIDKSLYEKLKEIARKRGRIHYQELAEILGEPYNDIDERNKFHKKLGDISISEYQNGKPLLSVLVLVKSQFLSNTIEMPGEGFFQLAFDSGAWDGENKQKFFYDEIKKVHGFWSKNKEVK